MIQAFEIVSARRWRPRRVVIETARFTERRHDKRYALKTVIWNRKSSQYLETTSLIFSVIKVCF